jgi:hypothetical protein
MGLWRPFELLACCNDATCGLTETEPTGLTVEAD